MYPQNLIAVLISTLVAVSSSPIVTPNRDSRFLFRNSLIPHFHHWQQQQQQQQPFFYRTPSFGAEPAPYDDYPVDSWHQPEPEPEPEPDFSRFSAPEPAISTYSAFGSNVLAPSERLQPPPAQQQPLRIFFLISRFPWPLEPVVQRVQNYYSTYTVPHVEPILDEEVDLGPEPVVEDVNEQESLASLANATSTTTEKPPVAELEADVPTGTRISASEDVKSEQTTEPVEEATEASTEEGLQATEEAVTDDPTEEPPTTPAKDEEATTTSRLPPLDDDILLA